MIRGSLREDFNKANWEGIGCMFRVTLKESGLAFRQMRATVAQNSRLRRMFLTKFGNYY